MSYLELENSEEINRKHGVSYYFATMFFPQKTRQATFAIYAFFRVPDDIVDNEQKNDTEKAVELQNFIDSKNNPIWQNMYKIFLNLIMNY
jgi:phytoene/squalene synthetase